MGRVVAVLRALRARAARAQPPVRGAGLARAATTDAPLAARVEPTLCSHPESGKLVNKMIFLLDFLLFHRVEVYLII